MNRPSDGYGPLRARKKPVVVEAMLYTGPNFDEVGEWCGAFHAGTDYLIIKTLEGNHRANPGDWVIKGVKGEFYPCKPDIFDQTYEVV